jgi:hypothetical protein
MLGEDIYWLQMFCLARETRLRQPVQCKLNEKVPGAGFDFWK